MKKLLLSLMVLASLVSCGKDSKSDNGITTVTNAVSINDQVALDLGSKINNSELHFPAAPFVTTSYYRYSVVNVTNGGQDCEEKKGWFGIKYTVCKSSNDNSNATYRNVSVGSVTIEAKRNELISIINSSGPGGIVQYGYANYQVTSTAGVRYFIDLNAPLEANPVVVQPYSGEVISYMGVFK